MNGNRKHGFMRGNNGFGAKKGFFCEGCQREHGPSVERTLLNSHFYCDKQYLKLKELVSYHSSNIGIVL